MNTPFMTLIRLDSLIIALDFTQEWINLARTEAPEDQELQLSMDRRQAEVDEKRRYIVETMVEIAMSN